MFFGAVGNRVADSPLYPRLSKAVFDDMNLLHTAQLKPWRNFHSGLSVSRFNGDKIEYSGIKFGGSPRQVFWSRYIDPFLKDMVVRHNSQALKLAVEKGVDPVAALDDVRGLMHSVGRKTYREMADIDLRLRVATGDSVLQPRNCDPEISRFFEFVDRHYDAERKMVKKPNQLERWFDENKALAKILSAAGAGVVAVLAALIKN